MLSIIRLSGIGNTCENNPPSFLLSFLLILELIAGTKAKGPLYYEDLLVIKAGYMSIKPGLLFNKSDDSI